MNMQLATGKSTTLLFLEGNTLFIPLETGTLNLPYLHHTHHHRSRPQGHRSYDWLFLHFPWGLVTLPMAEFNCRLKFCSMLPNMVPWCQIVILVNLALCPECYSSQHCQFLQRRKIQKWISLCRLHQSVLFNQSSTWATNALISITVKGVIQWRCTDNVNFFIMLGLRPLPPQQNTVSLSDPQLNKSGAVFNSNYKETCCHGFLNAEKWTSD